MRRIADMDKKSHLYSLYNVNEIYPYITKHEIFSYTISLRSVYTKRAPNEMLHNAGLNKIKRTLWCTHDFKL